MSDISELETRITKALEAISEGVETLANREAAVPDDTEELTRALNEERTAYEQLEARLTSVHEKTDARIEELSGENEALSAALATAEKELRALRIVNDELTENAAALREQVQSGMADAHLLNKTMLNELESLRAARRAAVAEMDTILAEMTPLLEDN